MNPYKYLVWEYSPNNDRWFDATELIEWLEEGDYAYFVKFKNKDEAIHVSDRKLIVYKDPVKIDYLLIEHKGVPQYKTKQCLLFKNKYKIFFENGYALVADKADITIYKDTLKDDPTAKGILSYYRRVVQLTAKTEEDAFMLSQFDMINNINEQSILSCYLKGENGSSSCPLNRAVISPFGTNLSQFNAVEKAFKKRISIIEGPPGTGKTQSILNLIANAVVKGYKVAVVSNNNSAIDNVYEKLDKLGFSFLCAKLGNKENTETFFEHINSEIPNLETNESTKSQQIELLTYSIPHLFSLENKKNKLKEAFEEIKIEYDHFLNEHADFNFENNYFKFKQVSKDQIMSLLVFLSETNKEKFSFIRRFILSRKAKVKKSFFKLKLSDQILLLQNEYFLIRFRDIEFTINAIDKELENNSFNDALTEYKNLSLIAFKNSLRTMFADRRKNIYEKDDYKMNFDEFTKDYPVILSSTYALAKSVKNNFLFDYLIVDESSQVNMASAILSMRVAKNLVVVGDIKQLPQIDEQGFAEINKKLLEQYNVDKAYSYYGHSIMSSILDVYKNRVPRTLLREHYRCHPEIIGFCNKEFYDNQLIVYSKNVHSKPLRLIKLVEGNHARKNPNGEGGLYSEREADEIFNLVNKEHPDDLGVISPYRIQVKTIADKLSDNKIDVSTIHKFQGREKKNIILSTVVNDSNDFVDDPNMINVAVSRAVDNFTLIASDKVVKGQNGVLADLVNYITYHSDYSEVGNGSVSSVFDLLYSDYSDQLERFRKRHPSKDYDTENIVKNLLVDIVRDSKFNHLRFSMHVPLRDIFRGKFIPMDKDELKYFFHPWTHADFVIFNKYSKKPVAIIEVDGVSFHEQNKSQKARDVMKDSIIKKAGLRFVRLKTNESNEKERIINLLG